MEFTYSDREHIFALRQLDKFMEGHGGFIAGGCFKNLFSGERMKDVDVFFRDRKDYESSVTALSENEDYERLYDSENVVAFRHKSSKTTVELIQTIFGAPEEILDRFDFTVAKFAYYREDTFNAEGEPIKVYRACYHPQFFEHLHLKRLIIDDKIPKPLSTFERVLRYRGYGYHPCTETKRKLINALRALPENDILVPTNFYDGWD